MPGTQVQLELEGWVMFDPGYRKGTDWTLRQGLLVEGSRPIHPF